MELKSLEKEEALSSVAKAEAATCREEEKKVRDREQTTDRVRKHRLKKKENEIAAGKRDLGEFLAVRKVSL